MYVLLPVFTGREFTLDLTSIIYFYRGLPLERLHSI